MKRALPAGRSLAEVAPAARRAPAFIDANVSVGRAYQPGEVALVPLLGGSSGSYAAAAFGAVRTPLLLVLIVLIVLVLLVLLVQLVLEAVLELAEPLLDVLFVDLESAATAPRLPLRRGRAAPTTTSAPSRGRGPLSLLVEAAQLADLLGEAQPA